jgi:uncharacterized protein (DUF433 family)
MRLVSPGITRALSPRSQVRLYVFQDLVELLVVAELVRRDFHTRNIRRVVERLRREYDRPLRQLVFATAGGEIYFQHPDGEWEGDRAKDQIVLQSVIIDLDVVRARIQQDTERRSEDSGRLERRRKVHGSKPVFAGTRIPVESVRRYLRQGYDIPEILAAYPELTAEDVEAARQHMGVA